MTLTERIISDFVFAEGQREELTTMAAVLRYVAALNPEATVKEFIECAVEMGYRANTARNRFNESRAFDAQFND
jgi:hypothetical protein